ncbi:MAG: SIR2 family protein [Prevotellaceae bacterium]|nr:SIR2 family protein [Prevotellaceae bacterium]
MSDEEKKNMEILIRRGDIVSYDSDKLYRNNIEIPKIDEDKRCTKDRAEAEKQAFYDTFFRQPFKHIIILAAAGTSLDNGSNKGETRNGLWKSGRDVIKQLYKELLPCDNKLRRIANDKDIEAFLSHILLVEKISEEKASRLKPLREQLEKIIRDACQLELDSSNAPHKTFLDKITARKASEPRVQLFTTNYDTLFEQAAQEGGYAVIDGFSFTFPRTFSGRYFDYDIVQRERTRLKDEESFVSKVFHLYKMHGSLTWEKTEQGIVQQVNSTESPLIVYPASDKYESSYEQPYFEMMSRFQQALRRENTLLIVVGFGFRDKHIQNVILEAVNQNPSFQLVIVNYNSNETIDREELKEYFDGNEVKRNVSIVFDTFKNFTESFPENKTYSSNEESIQS